MFERILIYNFYFNLTGFMKGVSYVSIKRHKDITI